jgi:hypothetical protein
LERGLAGRVTCEQADGSPPLSPLSDLVMAVYGAILALIIVGSLVGNGVIIWSKIFQKSLKF